VRLRRWICWLSLVIIVSGAPARQAEAAADCARTMAELDDDQRIEEVDGGVGDDSLEATRADAPVDSWAEAALGFPTLGPLLGLLTLGEPGWDRLAASVVLRLPARSGRRQAWLGCFLF